MVTGSTYAYLVLEKTDNSLAGNGGCSVINYRADEIDESDLLATTNYLNGAKSTVTLSEEESCEIYDFVNIYFYTDVNESTIPLDTVKALKYNIVVDNILITEGVIDSYGDFLLATVPLTSDPIDYDIYLWVDSDISRGHYSGKSFSGYIYATTVQSSTVDDDASVVSITYDYNYLPDDEFEDVYNTELLEPCCGGTPLVSSATKLTEDGKVYSASFTERGWYFSPYSTGLTLGERYTYSFEARADVSYTLASGREQGGGFSHYEIGQNWQRYTNTFVASSNSNPNYIAFVFYTVAGNMENTLEIRNLQIQKGELYKATMNKTIGEQFGVLVTPARSGWVFQGWYTAPVGGTKITSTTNVPSSDTTYYAQWKKANYNDFTENILKPNAKTDENIDFSKTSEQTNTNGIYVRNGTENNQWPIYYYRGAVDNNLIFANTCWKIIRTTETGGLKLIYNGLPSNGQCNNMGESTQIGFNSFNVANSIAYVGYMYSPYIYTTKTMTNITGTYYYGNSVTYQNGQYTLINTISSNNWSSIYNGGLNNNHYTCFSSGTTCQNGEVYYIYRADATTAYYIALTDGKKIEDALDDMLGKDDSVTKNYNTVSSTVKGNKNTSNTLDYWYYQNIELKGYGNYVEDTIWCNDRSIYQKNGWDPNGGNITSYLYFGSYGRTESGAWNPSLVCPRDIDKFTVSKTNGNGSLNYPVGFITADEIVLAGGINAANNSYYLYTGATYWTGSPYLFINNGANVNYMYSNGYMHYIAVNGSVGVRPSISLKPGFKLTGSGTGTTSAPYIIE